MDDVNATVDRLMGNQAPVAPQRDPAKEKKARAIMLALLPIAMAKGGRGGVAGVLAGYQRTMHGIDASAQANATTQFNQQRLMAGDARADRQLGLQEQQFARTTEQDAIRAKELERARFLEQAQAMGAIDQSPEAAMTALSGLAPQATALGVPQAALETQFAVTPSAAQARKIRGLLARVDTEWKGKADQEQIDAMVVQDPVAQGKTVGQLRAMLTGVAAPTGPKADKYAALKQTLTANPRQWNSLLPTVQTELLASGFVPPRGPGATASVSSEDRVGTPMYLVGPNGQREVTRSMNRANALFAQGWTQYDATAARQRDQAEAETKSADTDKATARSAIAALALDLANDSSLSDISGTLGEGWRETFLLPGNAEALRKYDELLNKIVLSNKGDFKGQGAVSNYERQMAAKSVGLSRQVGFKDFKKKILSIASEYGGGSTTTQLAPGASTETPEARSKRLYDELSQ